MSIHGLSSFDNGGGGGQDDDDEPINPIDALPEDEVILLPGIVLEITSIRRFKGQNLTEGKSMIRLCKYSSIKITRNYILYSNSIIRNHERRQ